MGLAKPRIQAAGYKSEAAFVRGARLVEVSMDDAEPRLVARLAVLPSCLALAYALIRCRGAVVCW